MLIDSLTCKLVHILANRIATEGLFGAIRKIVEYVGNIFLHFLMIHPFNISVIIVLEQNPQSGKGTGNALAHRRVGHTHLTGNLLGGL